MKPNHTITDVPGLRVGQVQNDEALTGCTVVICERGAVAGVDQRGGAPGTRETDLLHPLHAVQKVHAVFLAGGSAFGLDAAGGIMRYLEEKKVGFNVQVARVPIVTGAILLDLQIGRADIRPDAAMGYQACLAATTGPVQEGNFGAGSGATVGKILGMGQAMKSGIGTASIEIGNGIFVGSIVAVNAFGDIIDPVNSQIIAGARTIQQGPIHIGYQGVFADSLQVMRSLVGKTVLSFASRPSNTVIGIVATNARLTKEQANKVAQMAHDGLARAVRPAHTMLDGDTIFALSTGRQKADVNVVGAFAAEAMAEAIQRSVRAAQPAGGLPASSSLSV